MDQAPYGHRGPAAEILRLIQRHGPQEIKSLEEKLGVSANAVREQLQYLLGAGLVSARKLRRGAGRPAHVYSLTAKGQALFPQGYDVLLKLLIEELVKAEGAERAQQLLNAVGARLAEDMTGGEQNVDLRKQVQRVVDALDRRGMPIVLEEEGVVALQSWSCPYASIARDHPEICEMEQHMLERALDAQVTITERIIDGHAACRFMVRKNDSLVVTDSTHTS